MACIMYYVVYWPLYICSFFCDDDSLKSDRYKRGYYKHFYKVTLPSHEVTNMWLYMEAMKILASDIDLADHNSLSEINLSTKLHDDKPVYDLCMDS